MAIPDWLEKRIKIATKQWGRGDMRAEVIMTLQAAFPELFDGTHWLAPWDVTRELVRAGHRACAEDSDSDWGDGWPAARDAYLAKQGDE